MGQDNTQEWHSVIEISIKEVISGVIAEVLWFVFVCVRERDTDRQREGRLNMEKKTVDGLENPSYSFPFFCVSSSGSKAEGIFFVSAQINKSDSLMSPYNNSFIFSYGCIFFFFFYTGTH